MKKLIFFAVLSVATMAMETLSCGCHGDTSDDACLDSVAPDTLDINASSTPPSVD